MNIQIKKMNFLFIVAVFTLALVVPPGIVWAQEEDELEEIVVTANRVAMAANKIGSSVTVITAEDIAEKGYMDMGAVLRETPGVDFARNGTAGKNSTLFMRGSQSDHVLVMFDGIEINGATTGGANIADISLDSIERIEIIRGPQSTLYGGDALGGVINIITKRGSSGKPKVAGFFGAGSYKAFEGKTEISQKYKNFDYMLSYYRYADGGLSASDGKNSGRVASVDPAAHENEPDPYDNKTYNAKFGYQFGDAGFVDLTYRNIRSDVQYDRSTGGRSKDADDRGNRTEEEHYGFIYTDKLWGNFDYLFRGSFMSTDLIGNRASSNFRIINRRTTGEFQGNYAINKSNLITFGYERKQDVGESVNNFRSLIHIDGYFLQNRYTTKDDRTVLTLGGRVDDHTTAGRKWTHRSTISHQWNDQLRARGSFGTGFAPPDLNNLYFPNFGALTFDPNAVLNPETNEAWDAGIEYTFGNKAFRGKIEDLRLELTYFENRIKNLIGGFPPTNQALSRISGLELVFMFPFLENWILSGNATFQNPAAGDGLWLQRRSKRKGNVKLSYYPDAPYNLHFHMRHFGKRKASNFSSVDYVATSTVFDFSGIYELADDYRVIFRVENILNKHYQNTAGFSAPGVSGNIKLEYSIF